MSRKSNLVSVIIPCYNHGEVVEEAIDSVLAQTCQDFEIIVVNDGSDDKETISTLNNIDSPKTTVYHKENGGASSARNFGIKRSSGEYILTLDSDDMFAPSFLEKALLILETDSTIGMITSWVKRFNEKKTSYVQLKGGDIEDFIVKNHASASLLFRYQCWVDAGGFDEEIPGYEDWDFFIGVTKNGWSIYSIPEYLFYYRLVDGSNFDQHLKISPKIIKYMTEKHKDVFQKHIVTVLYEKERQLKLFRDSNDIFKNSVSLKIGNIILKPLRYIKTLV